MLLFVADNNGELPRLNNEEDAAKLHGIAQGLLDANKEMEIEDIIKIDELDKDVVYNVSKFARAQICP